MLMRTFHWGNQFSDRWTSMTNQVPLSSPGVRFPPPTIFVAGILAGWMLDRYWQALPFSNVAGAGVQTGGIVLVLAGITLVAWGMVTFRRARTAILPSHGASRLVSSGPYRFTRNPMYAGLTIAYLGGAALIDSAWPVIVLPIVLMALVRLVISREEAYLHDAFGAEYAAYQARVRRWITIQ